MPANKNKFTPTDEQRKTVRAMAGFGIPQDEIANVIINPTSARGIGLNTLKRHFRKELSTSATEVNAKVAESLYKRAMSGKDSAAAIFWTKARMGWSDRVEVKHTGEVDLAARMADGEKRVSQ